MFIYIFISIFKKIKENSMRQTTYTTSPMNQQNWNDRSMSKSLEDTDVG